MAGLFDGEGSIGIYKVTNGRGTNSGQKVYWTARAAIVGTHRPMIEAFSRAVGFGTFTTQKRQAIQRTPKGEVLGKQGWKWFCSNKPGLLLLHDMLSPHLIEKKAQFAIVAAYCRGEIGGEEASELCKEAKKFSFSSDGFQEYSRTKKMPTKKELQLLRDRLTHRLCATAGKVEV